MATPLCPTCQHTYRCSEPRIRLQSALATLKDRDSRPALWSGAADDRLGEPDLAGRARLQEVVVASLRRLRDVLAVQQRPAAQVGDGRKHRLAGPRRPGAAPRGTRAPR